MGNVKSTQFGKNWVLFSIFNGWEMEPKYIPYVESKNFSSPACTSTPRHLYDFREGIKSLMHNTVSRYKKNNYNVAENTPYYRLSKIIY